MKNKTIHISNSFDKITKKDYLENFVETVFINLNDLNPMDSLTIDQFTNKRYLRDFEKTLLESLERTPNFDSGTYNRVANELELVYKITVNM